MATIEYEKIDPEEKKNPSQQEWILVKPNGGWGWLVVLGVALSNMTTQAMISTSGFLFMRRLDELDIDTKGMSLIVSVQLTVFNMSGLFAGPALKKFSSRQIACFGASSTIIGLILTGYATSLFTIISTYSMLTGIGIGFLYPSTFLAIYSYFSTRRARAVGITVAGTSIGQMLLPMLVHLLLEEYNFKGAVLILSALSSHALIGASLYQPVEWHMKRKFVQIEEQILADGDNARRKGEEDRVTVADNTGKGLKRQSCFKKFLGILCTMDWDLLKHPPFLILIISIAMVNTANQMFQMLLPFFFESVDYTSQTIAICMSVLSGADVVGRLLVSTVTDLLKLKTKNVFFLGTGMYALATSVLVWYNKRYRQFYMILAICAWCGISRAAFICNYNLCVSDQAASEKVPSALGLAMVFKGISVLLVGPLIGFIRDYTQSYSFTMYSTSLIFLGIPFSLWLVEFIACKRSLK